jgi:hypothetical protein
MATIRLKARTVGADGVLRRFAVAAAMLRVDTLEAQRRLGKAAEVAFAAWVPIRSGRALRGINSELGGSVVTVTDYASNPQSGYDYIGVTRFGHGIIRPKRAFAAFNLHTKKPRSYHGPRSGHAPVLRFTVAGRVVFTPFVRAWKPASDWVTDALPEVEAQAQGVATALGRKIESRF